MISPSGAVQSSHPKEWYPCWTCWTYWTWSPASVHAAGLALLSAHASAPDPNWIVAQSIWKIWQENLENPILVQIQLSYNRLNIVMRFLFQLGFAAFNRIARIPHWKLRSYSVIFKLMIWAQCLTLWQLLGKLICPLFPLLADSMAHQRRSLPEINSSRCSVGKPRPNANNTAKVITNDVKAPPFNPTVPFALCTLTVPCNTAAHQFLFLSLQVWLAILHLLPKQRQLVQEFVITMSGRPSQWLQNSTGSLRPLATRSFELSCTAALLLR